MSGRNAVENLMNASSTSGDPSSTDASLVRSAVQISSSSSLDPLLRDSGSENSPAHDGQKEDAPIARKRKRVEPWREASLDSAKSTIAMKSVDSFLAQSPSSPSTDHIETQRLHMQVKHSDEDSHSFQGTVDVEKSVGSNRYSSSDTDGSVSYSIRDELGPISLSESASEEVFTGIEEPRSVKEIEALRLLELLQITETGATSQRDTRLLFKTSVVAARCSYETIRGFLLQRSGIRKMDVPMCPSGHAAASGSLSCIDACPCCGYNLRACQGAKFWYVPISDHLRALCMQKDSFEQIYNGCQKARRAVSGAKEDIIGDYYDGELFHRLHGERMRSWNEDEELYLFLTMSSDGFEVFEGCQGAKTAWPVVFTVLNFDPSHRFKAANALISAIIPGTHDCDHFETFLHPIIDDLCMLEIGIEVMCFDASKILGFIGHNGKRPCRACHKKSTQVTAAGSHYLIPDGTLSDIMMRVRRVLRAGHAEGELDEAWIDQECPDLRTSKQTARVWEALSAPSGISKKGALDRLLQDPKVTGIKRRPLLAKLTLDYVNSFPYDPMHLCLLGWVKLLLVLFTGSHKKHLSMESPYVLRMEDLELMNAVLGEGSTGIPAIWGRPPQSLKYCKRFKAEDFKSFGLYYAKILFHARKIGRNQTRLWALTSRMRDVVFDPTPSTESWRKLRTIVEELHALMTRIFYVDEAHAFCFTPTSHAILHLPEMLRECGPLLNVSQFLVERLVGEIGARVKSRVHPESNLFHKSQMLFCIRLMNGGMATNIREPSVSLRNSGQEVRKHNAPERHVLEYFKRTLPKQSRKIKMLTLYSHRKITLQTRDTSFDIECREEFVEREKRSRYRARQKFCVAGQYAIKSPSSEEFETEQSEENVSSELTYYGYTHRIWEATVCYTDVGGAEQQHAECLVEVDWQYGLVVNDDVGVVFVEGKRKRQRHRTVESAESIDRIIGFMDVGSSRYFIDPLSSRMKDNGSTIGGVARIEEGFGPQRC